MDVWKQFEENNLTHSAAHHLLAIMELKREQGYARVTDVARHLNITTGSASTNLKNLKAKGLVDEDTNRFLKLSDKGETLVKAVVARRDIFQKFLTELLGVSVDQAEIDACKTEHLLSHETGEKLLRFMQLFGAHFQGGTKVSKGTKSEHTLECQRGENCSVCEDHCLLEDC